MHPTDILPRLASQLVLHDHQQGLLYYHHQQAAAAAVAASTPAFPVRLKHAIWNLQESGEG
jgi:hypothetical protein